MKRRDGLFYLCALGAATTTDAAKAQVVSNGKVSSTRLRRLALVVGNARYSADIGKLPSPERDALAVADTLKRFGFDVAQHVNLGRHAMRNAIENFGSEVKKSDSLAIFYYSGHGAATDGGGEYLMPVDGRGLDTIREDGISVFDVLRIVSQSRGGHTLAILDSCRNRAQPMQNVRKSLAVEPTGVLPLNEPALRAVPGTTVVYAAGLNQVAIDQWNQSEKRENSLYTHFLLRRISAGPRDSMANIFDSVSKSVAEATANLVTPGTYNEGGGLSGLSFHQTSEESPARASTDMPDTSHQPIPVLDRSAEKRPCAPKDTACLSRREPPAPVPLQ